MTNLIDLRAVSKYYGRGERRVWAVRDMVLSVARQEFVAVVGARRSGKSTLLKLVGGLDAPSAGAVEVASCRIDRMPPAALRRWRLRTVGFVFQVPQLLPTLGVADNVELPLLLRGLGAAERADRRDLALELAGAMALHRRRPRDLTPSQQARVAIARAIVCDPLLLACDEPAEALDPEDAGKVLTLLRDLQIINGLTVLLVTRDARTAACADRILRLEQGRLHPLSHRPS